MGFEPPTFRMRDKRSNPLCHRRGSISLLLESWFKTEFKENHHFFIRFSSIVDFCVKFFILNLTRWFFKFVDVFFSMFRYFLSLELEVASQLLEDALCQVGLKSAE